MPPVLPYKTYGEFIAERFPWKMQKLAVNAGFTCPNRDGSIGKGGCVYCNNKAFSPSYCDEKDSVTVQLEKGKDFFGRKYPDMHYLAYFQAYTSTYSSNRDYLISLYREACRVFRIEGIIISTRPDCVDTKLFDSLKEIEKTGKRVMLEFGVETSHDATLKIINRGHTWIDCIDAVKLASEYGYDACAHLIMGLPNETEDQMIETVRNIVRLPVTSIKFHQLQIIKGTPLENDFEKMEIKLFTVEEYLDLCKKIISIVPREIAIERFTASAPKDLLIAPKWGIKNYEFVNMLYKK